MMKSRTFSLRAFYCIIVIYFFNFAHSQTIIFEQNFNGATIANISGTSSTTSQINHSDYFTSTGEANKFTNIITGGHSTSYIGITGGSSGVFLTTDAGSSFMWLLARTANIAETTPTAIKITFRASFDVNSTGTTNPRFHFQIGNNFSNTYSSTNLAMVESNTNVFMGFTLKSSNSTSGASLWRNDGTTQIGTTNIGESMNTWTIVINNTGSSLSYLDPNNNTEYVADDTYDLWIGTTKWGNDLPATNGAQSLQNFKMGSFTNTGGGRINESFDWFKIEDLSPPSCFAPSISSQSTATQTKFVGESFNPMTVTASGTGTLSYQWYSSNDNVTNTSGDDLTVGTNSNSYTPSSASAGTIFYYCVVTGDCGTATSAISGAIVTNNTYPTVVLSSGSNSTSVNVNAAMTSAVYTYSFVGDDANVSAEWYTDDTYSSTTSAPSGLSITKDTEANTVTVSGTPANGVYGTLYYKLIVNETNGNSIEGTITVNVPTPAINLSSAAGTNAQTRKAGTAIVNITYTVTNASGATVSGLPTGLSGSYDSGTYTISGTIDNAATLGTANYTVTATAYTGYEGSPVTASGSVVVKSATAKDILYLTTSNPVPALDNKLYPHLNNNSYYLVTVKVAAGTAPATSYYDPYDLIVLNEFISSGNTELNAIINIDKPILNLKSFNYNSGSGRWNWGTADNGQANNGTVVVKQPNHPIFEGITLNSGTLELLSGAATKGVQPFDYTNIGGITVATAPKFASPNNHAVAIHDVPASVRGVSNSKYLLVALCNDSYDKITNNALTLFDNAVDYLLNGEQYVAEPIHFRSRATGNWASTTLWDSSPDNTNWGQHVAAPTSNSALSIAIQSGHTITVAANASAPAVNVKPTAKLTINADNTLTVTGNVTLESDADGSGTLINSGTLSASGTTTVQQHLTSGRNWYFASPISNATSNVIKGTEGNQLWERNVAGNAWTEITGTTADLTPGRGYIAKVAGTGVVSFTGALNNGQVQYPISSHGVASGKFHLVGNPYPSYLDWQNVVTANPDLMPTMWFRTKTAISEGNPTSIYTFSTVQYDGEELDVISGNANTSISRYIPPMQGFWVRIKDAVASTNFTVNNTMRNHADVSGNRFKAPVNTNTQRLRLVVSNGTYADETLLKFSQNASNGFDRYDSPKMFNNNAAIPEIYTRAGNERLVINGMNGYDFNTIIPLGFVAGQAGSFSIRSSELQNFDSDTQVYLLDKTSNSQFNLTSGESYNFTSDATSTEDRFAVLFKSASGTSSVGDNAVNGMYLSAQNGRLTLQLNTAIDNAQATVFTAAGQSIHSQAVSAPTTVLNKSLDAGVYVVKIVNGGRTTVLRTIIH